MGEIRNAYKIFMGKSEGKRPLRRYKRRWEDNIRMDLREIRFEVLVRIRIAQEMDQWRAVMNTVTNFRKFGGFLDQLNEY
jgi:hypothetical protein